MAEAYFYTRPDRDKQRRVNDIVLGQPQNDASTPPGEHHQGHAAPIRLGRIHDKDVEPAEYDDDGKLTKNPKGEAKLLRVKEDGTGSKVADDPTKIPRVKLSNILPMAFTKDQTVLLIRDQSLLGRQDNLASSAYYPWPFPTTMPFACLSEAHSVSESGFDEGTAEFDIPFTSSETNDESVFGFEGGAGDETTIIVKAAGKYLVIWAVTIEPDNTQNPSLTIDAADEDHPTTTEIASAITAHLNQVFNFAQNLIFVRVVDTTTEPDENTDSDTTRASSFCFIGVEQPLTTAGSYQTAEIKAASKIKLRLTPQVTSFMSCQIGGGYMLVLKVAGVTEEEMEEEEA